MNTRVSLLPIGDELTTGAISDTNAQLLATELTLRGFEVVRILSVRDRIPDIVAALQLATVDSDVVITTGGLGPTTDDITRDAVAAMIGKPLILSEDSLNRMQANYRRRNIPLNKISDRQSYFPEGSKVIVNPVGTADSFSLRFKGGIIYSIPGVPREAKEIAELEIFPELEQLYPKCKKRPGAFLKVFGFSESHVGTVIEGCNLPAEIRVAYRPVFPEIWVRFSDERSDFNPPLSTLVNRVAENIGRAHVVSERAEETLSEVVIAALKERKIKLACAESCTGGLVSNSLVSVPGASEVFLGSAVVYSIQAKERLLGVKATAENVVSEEIALAMALAARKKFEADIAIGVTGVAGPDGGSEKNPVGTVCFGIAAPDLEQALRFSIPFERNRMRGYAAHLGLDLIRRYLSGFQLKWERF